MVLFRVEEVQKRRPRIADMNAARGRRSEADDWMRHERPKGCGTARGYLIIACELLLRAHPSRIADYLEPASARFNKYLIQRRFKAYATAAFGKTDTSSGASEWRWHMPRPGFAFFRSFSISSALPSRRFGHGRGGSRFCRPASRRGSPSSGLSAALIISAKRL